MAILVTKNAWTKLGAIMKAAQNSYGFLFSASSGGCNGFNCQLGLLDKKTYDELNSERFINILENEESTRVYVDPLTEIHLSGTTIDYVFEDLEKGVFEKKFVYNVDKDLMATCGCGSSFVPKKIRD